MIFTRKQLSGARQRICRAALTREPGKENRNMGKIGEAEASSNRITYLLAELHCASLRARLQRHDIDAIGLALKGGLITPEQAIALLADCDCLQFISPEGP